MQCDIAIVGAGPAGLAAAHAVVAARRVSATLIEAQINTNAIAVLHAKLALRWPQLGRALADAHCRPNTRVAVLERSDVRPRGAMVFLPPNGVR